MNARKFLASVAIGLIAFALVALADGPDWACVGFGFLAYLVVGWGDPEGA